MFKSTGLVLTCLLLAVLSGGKQAMALPGDYGAVVRPGHHDGVNQHHHRQHHPDVHRHHRQHLPHHGPVRHSGHFPVDRHHNRHSQKGAGHGKRLYRRDYNDKHRQPNHVKVVRPPVYHPSQRPIHRPSQHPAHRPIFHPRPHSVIAKKPMHRVDNRHGGNNHGYNNHGSNKHGDNHHGNNNHGKQVAVVPGRHY